MNDTATLVKLAMLNYRAVYCDGNKVFTYGQGGYFEHPLAAANGSLFAISSKMMNRLALGGFDLVKVSAKKLTFATDTTPIAALQVPCMDEASILSMDAAVLKPAMLHKYSATFDLNDLTNFLLCAESICPVIKISVNGEITLSTYDINLPSVSQGLPIDAESNIPSDWVGHYPLIPLLQAVSLLDGSGKITFTDNTKTNRSSLVLTASNSDFKCVVSPIWY